MDSLSAISPLVKIELICDIHAGDHATAALSYKYILIECSAGCNNQVHYPIWRQNNRPIQWQGIVLILHPREGRQSIHTYMLPYIFIYPMNLISNESLEKSIALKGDLL